VGYLVTLLFLELQLRWPAMPKSTLLDRQTHQDGRGDQACLIWSLKWYAVSFLVIQQQQNLFYFLSCSTLHNIPSQKKTEEKAMNGLDMDWHPGFLS
jgi:hypothetical protein